MKNIYRKIRMNLSLWLVLFVIFLDHVGVGLVYPLFSSATFTAESPFLTGESSNLFKGSFLGILLAATPLAAFFSSPILGALSDQKGRKPLFLFCLSFAIVGYLCAVVGVYMHSLAVLIFSRIIVGLADGSMGVVSAAIADLSKDESTKTKNFGLYSMVSGIGFALGPLLGGILCSRGFAIPFIAAGVATFVNLVLIWFFFEETHSVRISARIRWMEGIRNVQKAFRLQNLKILFLICVLLCLGWSFFYEFLPVVWIHDYQLNTQQIGAFFALGSISYALASGVLIRLLINRFRPISVLCYSLYLLGIVLMLLLVHPSFPWIFVYVPLVNILVAFVFPIYITMISNCATPESQGEILGISGSLQSFAFAASPLIGGVLVGWHTHMPMLIGGLSMLFAGVMGNYIVYKTKRKDRHSSSSP